MNGSGPEKYRGGEISRRDFLRFGLLVGGLAEAPGLLSACVQPATPGQAGTPGPQAKGPTTVTFASPIFIASGWGPPDVASLQDLRIAYHLYDTLTALDLKALAEGKPAVPVPNLAKSWRVDESNRVYTFEIRDGVRFSTGRPVTAEAIKKSFERAKKVVELAKLGGRYPLFAKITSIEAPDSRTLRIALNEPYAPFLATVAAPQYGVVDVEEVLKYAQGDDLGQGWLKYNSAGSGPYILEEYIPEQRIILKKNPDYWGGWDGVKPRVDRIIQLHVPEAATRQLMIQRGEADIVHGLDASQIRALEGRPEIQVAKGRLPTTVNFLADLRAGPLKDIRVRQALRYAIDYEGLKSVVAGGFAEVLQTNFLPGMLGYEPEAAYFYRYDPARAKRLLAEAGYSDGFEITLVSRDGAVGTVVYSKAITYYQQNLAEVGVKARIVEMTGAAMWGQISNKEFRAIGISAAAATVFDPDNPATIRAVQESGMLGWDDVDPEAYTRAAELTREGARELDPQRRARIYSEVSRLMVERGPYWTFLQVIEPVLYRSNISGIVFSPLGSPIDWRYLEKQ